MELGNYVIRCSWCYGQKNVYRKTTVFLSKAKQTTKKQFFLFYSSWIFLTQAYLETNRTSNMEHFWKVVNTRAVNYFRKKASF